MRYQLKYIISKIIRKIINMPAINHSKISRKAKCDIGTNVSYSSMGKYSYIGEFTSLSYVDVGSFTSISSGCTIGGGSHPLDWVSMSPVFQKSSGLLRYKFSKLDYLTHKRTLIGNDVWIGGDCLIKGGVKIGNGAVIGMGSVVTHDVGPYEIWAGSPAKFIKKRFDDQTILDLENIKWWEWEDKKIKQYAHMMNDLVKFINVIKKGY